MKKSIVLFTTLLLIMALMGVIMLFLNSTKKAKDSISYEFALIQTNSIAKNLSYYLDGVEFDENTIYYGSKMPFLLTLNDSLVNFQISSTHQYLNINTLATKMAKKNNDIYNNFINFLYQYNIKDPEFFVDLLLDTIDKNSEEMNSGSGSEIVLTNPVFRNGKIYNQKHFNMILDYYHSVKNDEAIYKVPFNKLISFNSNSIDINFASPQLLDMIFYDADSYSLDKIKNHKQIYEELSDLPFDEYYLKSIKKGRFGHSITVESNLIKVNVELTYEEQFKSNIEFLYNTKDKLLGGYTILDIKLLDI